MYCLKAAPIASQKRGLTPSINGGAELLNKIDLEHFRLFCFIESPRKVIIQYFNVDMTGNFDDPTLYFNRSNTYILDLTIGMKM